MPRDHADSAYATLRERAERALTGAPDGLSDGDLAAALFGSGPGKRWLPLLQNILNGDERVQYRDGRWRLVRMVVAAEATFPESDPSSQQPTCVDASVSAPEQSPISGSVIGLALATTGADPARHRIARISVVRRAQGTVTGRLDTPVQTSRRLAGYLRTAIRISDDELDSAPLFDEIVPALRELIEGSIVHAYGAKRARAFLDAEARRASLRPITATWVELDDLIGAYLTPDLKPGLQAAARELGVPISGTGVPARDANAVAQIVERLQCRLGASPGRSAVQPADAEDAVTADVVGPLPFTRAWLQTVPEGPGVYLFEDRTGATLYVGKATALRRRLAAYVGRQPGTHRQLEALAVRASRVTTLEATSDLEATLLEARLIQQRQPAFNVAQQARPPTTIIRAGPDEASPRIRLVHTVELDGARYFGPFESVSAARQALAVARAIYPNAFARKRGDIHLQRTAVLDACRLLAGQKEPAIEIVRSSMRRAAAAGDQLEVDRLRSTLRDIQRLEIRPSLLAGLPLGTQILVFEHLVSGLTRTHLLQDGRRLVSATQDAHAQPITSPQVRRLADEMMRAGDPGESDRDEAGRLRLADVSASAQPADPREPVLVLRWLTQAWARIEVIRVPRQDADAPA